MTQHAYDPTSSPRPCCDKPIADLSRDELIALFSWYDFTDAEGHPLESCQDFLDLIARAVA